MAHAQKPDSVFQRNGRVHLYRRGCQFGRVLAFLECGSGENDCSNTGWTVPSQTEDCLATHSIRLFPLHFSSRASQCATRFRFHSTTNELNETAKEEVSRLSRNDVILISYGINDYEVNSYSQTLQNIIDFIQRNNQTNIILMNLPYRYD